MVKRIPPEFGHHVSKARDPAYQNIVRPRGGNVVRNEKARRMREPKSPDRFSVRAVSPVDDNTLSAVLDLSDAPEGALVVHINPHVLQGGAGVFSNGPGDLEVYFESAGESGDIGLGVSIISGESSIWARGMSPEDGFSENEWVPVFVSWKTDLPAGEKIVQIYRADQDVVGAVDDYGPSFNAQLGSDPIRIFADTPYDGDIAELWFDDSFIDFSILANRRKFMNDEGKPIDLGADGSLPTGNAPLIYLSVRPGDTAADFLVNRGTGNNFTQSGVLTLADTSPSD
ncbi:hypothetical protein [Dongia sp.]|uniref:hypothetical protein n=1 Tax=Dongia sp. TaxID=1977262 RepID=UPI0035AE1E37